MIDALRAAVARQTQRMRLVIGRGKITQSKDDGPLQQLQVSLGPLEVANVPRVVEFGLASWPPDNCGAVVIFIAGERSNGVAIGTHDLPSRFKLGNKGEVALFDANGAAGAAGKWIWLKKGDGIEIQANGEKIAINGASDIIVNPPDGGATNVTLNLGGGDVTINDAGAVVLGPGGKKVVVDGDPIVGGGGGHVQASQAVVTA